MATLVKTSVPGVEVSQVNETNWDVRLFGRLPNQYLDTHVEFLAGRFHAQWPGHDDNPTFGSLDAAVRWLRAGYKS